MPLLDYVGKSAMKLGATVRDKIAAIDALCTVNARHNRERSLLAEGGHSNRETTVASGSVTTEARKCGPAKTALNLPHFRTSVPMQRD